jgi:hypothetical protein
MVNPFISISFISFIGFLDSMAEREGFEPPIALRLCLISSQVHSTGLCHLSAVWRLALPLTLCLINAGFVPLLAFSHLLGM